MYTKQSLLTHVMEYYHNMLVDRSPHVIEYLRFHNIKNPSVVRDFRLGYSDNTLKNIVPPKGEMLELLKSSSLLTEDSDDVLRDSLAFPILDEDGSIRTFSGFDIKKESHVYIEPGIFNIRALKSFDTIILVKDPLEAIKLYELGFKNAISIIKEDEFNIKDILKKYLIKEFIITFDTKKELQDSIALQGITIKRTEYPKDVSDITQYLSKGFTSKRIAKLIENSKSITTESKEDNFLKEDPGNDSLFIYFQNREYRIKGLSQNPIHSLKINIKLKIEDLYHIDTIDLYSAKQRELFIQQSKKTVGADEATLNKDLKALIDTLEKKRPSIPISSKNVTPQMTEYETTEALKYLKDPNLIDNILSSFKALGYVGEEDNLLMSYIASISRKLDDPLAILIISRSGAGKSTIQDAVLAITPKEDYERYTRLTSQALFYKGADDLAHKMLVIEEEKGVGGAEYSLRTLQSQKELSILSTTKDDLTGKLKTTSYTVKGPCAIMITTTKSDIDYETYNRFIILSIDESLKQTRLILERQREKYTLEGLKDSIDKDNIVRLHQNAQRLLKSYRIVNPYSRRLKFTDSYLRSRRDQPKYLAMINSVSLLRQYQKEIKEFKAGRDSFPYIEVELADIEIANRLANNILGKSLDELSPPARNLLLEVKNYVCQKAKDQAINKEDVTFSRKALRDYSGWSPFQIKTHIRELVEFEYILPLEGRRGKLYQYKLIWAGEGVTGDKFLMGLREVSELRGRWEPS